MAHFTPQSLSTKNDGSFIAFPGDSTQSSTTDHRMAYMQSLVIELSNPDLRENALYVLSKSTKLFEELGPLLWNTVGTIAVFLQEIISIYATLSPKNLSPSQSTRVCNVLALLQCVASHPDTRISFFNANIPLYLYPFLKTTSKLTHFENLRVASLGVIGGSMKVNTKEAIGFYLSSEIISLCLSNMQNGNELTKIVATFIILKIILADDGLARVCATTENFFGVCRVLNMMLEDLENPPSSRLLRLLISCYSRLSQNCRARVALTTYLPNRLKDANLINFFRDDPKTMRSVLELHENVGVNRVPLEAGRGGIDDIVGPSLSRK